MNKFRKLENQFIVEGDKLVQEALSCVPEKIKTILYTEKSELYSSDLHGFNVFEISESDLMKISSQQSPQHSIAVLDGLDCSRIEKPSEKIILLCDGIQDPGNFGTIIRTADWFGISTIVASKNTVDFYNQKVIQSSMGSIFRVQVNYVDLPEWLENSTRLKVGTLLEGKDIFTVQINEPCALVIGSEGQGISSAVKEKLDIAVTIPRMGGAESLNASVATGIALSELSKVKI
jgi:TrmH family RNA methyltransferase